MRVFNFSAGPSTLPLSVLTKAQAELLDYQGTGMSVMEMSHRSPPYQDLAEASEARLRRLLGIPDDYRVLFLQGGATAQFAAVPLNLVGAEATVAYLDTGIWSQKAIEEAERFVGRVCIAGSSRETGYRGLPEVSALNLPDSAAYLHYTANETIGGVEFKDPPEPGQRPLIADMSSNLLSRVLDIRRFGLIYAGAQKNMGPSGVTVVIVRQDLLDQVPSRAPAVLDYGRQSAQGSMLNTPATYPWYLLGAVLEWLEAAGGVPFMDQESTRKSEFLYAAIDASALYRNDIEAVARSRMNIPFRLVEPQLESLFLKEARERGLVNLEGHRSVGGLRASLYNAMPYEGVVALVGFMRDFEARHG